MPLAARTAHGISYDREGPYGGVPVVLVHAGIADRRMWDAQWQALTAVRDVVRLDLRGYGESADEPAGPLAPVADLLGLLDELGIDRCHLVGASFGSGVVVEAALTRPGLAASLLLCPPGGSLLAELTEDLQRFFDAEEAALESDDLDGAVEANVAAWVAGPRRAVDQVDPAVVEQVRIMQRRAFEIVTTWSEDLEGDELDPPALERLGEIIAPTLLVIGGLDLDTTLDAAGRVQAGVAGARRVDWPDVAHLPSMERPDDFTALLLAWTAPPADAPPTEASSAG